jgi:hypothetical protein
MPPGARFPDGWKFIIDPTIEGNRTKSAPVKGAEGLKILPPTGSFRYNSVEAAKARHAKGLKDVCPGPFYAHIGVVSTDVSRSLTLGSESISLSHASDEDGSPQERRGVSSPMTLEDLLKNKCGECVTCAKDDCGRCASCVSHSNSKVCIPKVSREEVG